MTELTKHDIAEGIVQGLKQLAEDKEFMSAFWKHGYEELVTHTGNNASMWVGKRLLTAFVLALTVAGITWLVRSGGLK